MTAEGAVHLLNWLYFSMFISRMLLKFVKKVKITLSGNYPYNNNVICLLYYVSFLKDDKIPLDIYMSSKYDDAISTTAVSLFEQLNA